jgi:hypothetical protein
MTLSLGSSRTQTVGQKRFQEEVAVLRRVASQMFLQRISMFERFPAESTLELLLSAVSQRVDLQVVALDERLATDVALVRLFSGVTSDVHLQMTKLAEQLAAGFALVWFFACVDSCVNVEVTFTGKRFQTDDTIMYNSFVLLFNIRVVCRNSL